jgi:Uma2 family endonuclease
MTVPTPPVTVDDEEFYPLHQEDDVPEIPDHRTQHTDLGTALALYLPDAFITGNVCVYWEQGNRNRYVAPDLFVVRNWRPPQRLRTYRAWEHPPIVFIAEVLSLYDYKPRQESMEAEYATHLRVPEYLSFHLERKELKLRRLGPDGYEEVTPEPTGRVRSQELQLEFGMDETGFLRAYTLDGRRLPNAEELKLQLSDQEQRRGEAEARADEEAERRAQEARRRQEAEARAADEARQREEEARQRQAAEARAAQEAQQRQAAEARAAEEARQREELEGQLAALRAQLQERGE